MPRAGLVGWLLAGAVALLGAGCLHDDVPTFDPGAPVYPDAGSNEPFTDAFGGGRPDVDASQSDAALVCEGIDPLLDSDGDGLLDIVEDRNLNCRVDGDETDPFNPDSDGDGLLDGEEDVNQNGVADLDRGEFDPRLADTDGNGILDSDEPEAPVCSSALPRAFAGYRVSLGTDRVYFVDPSLRMTPFADGAIVLTSQPEQGEAAVLLSAGTLTAPPASVVQALQEGMLLLGGRMSTLEEASRALGSRWSASYQLEFATPIDARQILLPLAVAFGLDPTPVSEESWLAARAFRVRIIAELDAEGAIEGRAVFAISPSPTPDAWFSIHTLASIAPRGTPFVRTRCERLEARRNEDVDIVVVVDSSTLASPAREAAAQALFQLLEIRSAASLRSRVWIVPGDAQARASLGASVLENPVVSASAARDALLGMEEGGLEQHLWRNAVEALETIVERDTIDGEEGRSRLLMVVSSREDADFREGATRGRWSSDGGGEREGTPDEDEVPPPPALPPIPEAPLPEGADRQSMTDYYVRKLRSIGSLDVIAVAPSAYRGVADDCVGLAAIFDYGDELGAARSFRDVAVRLGGSYLELCNPDLEPSLLALASRSSGADGSTPLRDNPIPNTLRVAIDGAIVPGDTTALQRVDAERTELRVRQAGELPLLGVAYMHWEGANAPDRPTP